MQRLNKIWKVPRDFGPFTDTGDLSTAVELLPVFSTLYYFNAAFFPRLSSHLGAWPQQTGTTPRPHNVLSVSVSAKVREVLSSPVYPSSVLFLVFCLTKQLR